MSTAFVQYLAKQFDDDVANADGEGEHEELLAKVSAVSDWLGVPSDAAQSRLSEILDGFREDEKEAEAVHPAAGAPSVQAGDDASIRNLFDGLTV